MQHLKQYHYGENSINESTDIYTHTTTWWTSISDSFNINKLQYGGFSISESKLLQRNINIVDITRVIV